MPEQVEFARQAVYMTESTPNHPDGIAMFRKTEPMKVPFSFKLHAFDAEYCSNGPLSLLDMAGRLHSLVLTDFQDSVPTTGSSAPLVPSLGAASLEAQKHSQEQLDEQNKSSKNPLAVTIQPWVYPGKVTLVLIGAGPTRPGVAFSGYVESVKVVFFGPWLLGEADGEFNLPSAAQFDFTIVHNPNYEGLVPTSPSTGIPAETVFRKFYNTIRDSNLDARTPSEVFIQR